MSNIKPSQVRQKEIKELWANYKNENKQSEILQNEIESLKKQWQKYQEKIEANALALEDYTNLVENKASVLPGNYLCNFLEQTTSLIFGSSKPGNANNFAVRLNTDNVNYTIRKNGQNNVVKKDEANNYFINNIQPLLKDIISEKDIIKTIELIECSFYPAKQILRKIAVLENIDKFLFIYSDENINALYEEFFEENDPNKTTLGRSFDLRVALNKILDIESHNDVDSVLLSRFLLEYLKTQSYIDKENPNVILYGPPGTGKTYTVKKSLNFICKGDRSRYKFITFHPSFCYEDFIEGIKPKGVTKDGNIKFELVQGVFKSFCKKAKENPNQDYYFVVDEINRANLSAVFGETLLCLEKDYRHDALGEGNENLVETQYSPLIKDLIKDNPTQYKDLAYHLIDNDVYFGVPKNIYFIGMMNDVDKSIDSFDIALRRRFKWIRMDCDYSVLLAETTHKSNKPFLNIDSYIKACKKLNTYISSDLNLGKSYEFGHSFFMKISSIAINLTISKKNLENLFNLYLQPTLKEYLRSIFTESELEDKLIDARNLFTNSLEKT